MAKNTLGDDLEQYRRQQEAIQAINEKIRSSLKNMGEYYKDMRKLSASIEFITGKIKDLEAEKNKLDKEAVGLKGKQLKLKQKEIDAVVEQIELGKQRLEEYKETTKEMKKQLNMTNLMVAGAKDIWKFGKQQSQWFFEQDKAIKRSALNMGVLNKQARGYWDNIQQAALQTNVLGATAADLAKMQANYSEEIGRMVILTKEGNFAMAEMAEGTALGADGAAAMAAAMDTFGVSVISTNKRIQGTVDLAHKMGMNASKVLKSLQQNLKIAQTYNFKAGIKGLTQMTMYSEKLKMNMQSIAGFAEKLQNPEGAVEAAAQLQVLGGAWSQLADPFRLMYEARNDMEAFTKSIGEATAGTFRFNRATGEVDKSALELNRLREIAKATGISFDELSTIAHRMATIKSIDMDISPKFRGNSKEAIAAREFIESSATWSKDQKGFVITFDNSEGVPTETLIKDLNAGRIKDYIAQKETMAERAQASKSFDEQWTNVVNTFKTALMPLLKGVFEGLSGALKKFTDWAKSGAFQKLSAVGKWLGDKLGWFIESLANSPILTIGAVLGGWIGLKAATWLLNGVMLGKGFMSVASSMGMRGGPGGMGGGVFMGGGAGATGAAGRGIQGGGFKNIYGLGRENGMNRLSAAGMAAKNSMPKWGMGARMGGAAAGMLAGGFLSSQQEGMDPSSAGSKALGIAGSTATYAGMGAMFGPWGALAGGILGLVKGAVEESKKVSTDVSYSAQGGGKTQQDFVSRPGSNPFPISNEDTLIGGKKGGPLEGILNSMSNTANNVATEVKHVFDNIKIEFGKLELVGEGLKENIDFNNNPIFIRELSKLVSVEIAKSIGGGKINTNTGRN